MTKIKILKAEHLKSQFNCGVPELNNYLQKFAHQDMKRKVAVTYVLLDDPNPEILGYYTLSGNCIQLEFLPEHLRKKFPKYPALPAILLGRLAMSTLHQGKGLGEIALLDALQRSFEHSKKIGTMAVIVEAKSPQAVKFYEKYGFIKLNDTKDKLLLPMKTIETLVERELIDDFETI